MRPSDVATIPRVGAKLPSPPAAPWTNNRQPELLMRYLALLLLQLVIASPTVAQQKPFKARISTTAYGVVHVKAQDLAGAGFGHGYALAASDICTIADRWVTVRAERSRYFGIEGVR